MIEQKTIDLHGTSWIIVELSKTGGQKDMMTVKEIAEITNISARTLHYYDEIGLLEPTAKSKAGYRLYDDKALEALELERNIPSGTDEWNG